MKKVIIFAVIFLTAATTLAQDPYMPDTVIVGTVYVDLGQPYADVPIYAVTDDRVSFYTIPTTWSSDSESIVPSDVFYYQMLEHWDNYDSVLFNQHFLRMWGCLYNVPFDLYLETDSIRLHCWTIRYSIDSLAPPQVVAIDTTYDPVCGSLLFGLEDGITAFVPIFIPGAIYYGITSDAGDDRTSPEEIALLRNYPNPFNATTAIEFTLPKVADIKLSIYNILGQKIVVLCDGPKTAGKHAISWNAGVAPSGLYFARLETEGFNKYIKMTLLK